MGDNSVCDYLDFITVQGKEQAFSGALLDYLSSKRINNLVLETLRPDSVAARYVVEEAKTLGHDVSCSQIDVSFEMPLPSTWEEYLASLESRHRRDIERKIRQLEKVADVRFSILRDAEVGQAELALFFEMMAGSRRDKAQFLTPGMRDFFAGLVHAMSAYGFLRLAFLDVGKARVAGILYFEYNGRVYLYNSGYDPQFADMDVGLVSKLYCIRQAIESGIKEFDFLKGSEVYKSQLGGREVKLSRCVVKLG